MLHVNLNQPSSHLAAQYLTRNSKQKYYFPFSRWESYIDLYQHLLTCDHLSFIVTGVPGSGKTTLLHHLQDRLADSVDSHYVVFNDTFAIEQLQRMVQEAVPVSSSPSLLIIDDAHTLPMAALDFLIGEVERQAAQDNGLRIMLCGSDMLSHRLGELSITDEALEQRFHHLHVTPLSLAEMREYLTKRLLYREQSLSSAQWHQIHQLAEGHMDTMLAIAKKMLQEPQSAVTTPRRLPRRAIAFVTVSLISLAVILSWGYYFLSESGEQTHDTVALSAGEMSSPISSESMTTSQSLSTQPQTMPSATSAVVLQEAEAGASALSERDIYLRQQRLALIKQELASIIADRKIHYVKLSEQGFLAMSKHRAQRVGYKQTLLQNLRRQRLQQVHDAHLPNPNKSTVTLPVGYTIQLLGTHSKPALLEFMAQHQLNERGAYYVTLREGQLWYLLTLGQHPTIEAARKALQTLPPALRQTKPWVRSFASIEVVDLERNLKNG
jgi:DamX protein